MVRVCLISSLLVSTCFLRLPAQEGFDIGNQSERTAESNSSGPTPAAEFGWYRNRESDLNTTSGSFTSTEYRLKVPFYGAMTIGDRLRVGFKARYSYHQIDTSSDANLFDHDLHRLGFSADAIYKNKHSPWFCWVRVAPALSTDFDASFEDGLTATSIASLGYEWSDDLSIALGVFAGQSFGEFEIYPAIGIRWTINDTWRLDLLPPTLTLSWAPIDRAKVHLAAFPGGGSWAIETEDGRFDELGYRNIRIGLGIDYEVRPRLWASAWGGVNLFQELEYRDNGSIRFESEPDDSAFVFLGLRYDFW